MAIQETPPLGWPHTEAAKHYDQETHRILREATPPPEPTKKRSGCCGGVLVLLLIALAVAGVVVALLVGQWTENGDPAGEPIELAEETYLYENPGWEVEASAYVDGSDGVQLITWASEHSIGRVVLMEPDELSAHGWNEQPLLPSDVEWSEPQFYSAFSEAFADVRWTYAESVEPAVEASTPADPPSAYVVSYSIWGESTGEWGETLYTDAVLGDNGVWTISEVANDSANQ